MAKHIGGERKASLSPHSRAKHSKTTSQAGNLTRKQDVLAAKRPIRLFSTPSIQFRLFSLREHPLRQQGM